MLQEALSVGAQGLRLRALHSGTCHLESLGSLQAEVRLDAPMLLACSERVSKTLCGVGEHEERGVRCTMTFVPFAILVVLGVLAVVALLYVLARRWL